MLLMIMQLIMTTTKQAKLPEIHNVFKIAASQEEQQQQQKQQKLYNNVLHRSAPSSEKEDELFCL